MNGGPTEKETTPCEVALCLQIQAEAFYCIICGYDPGRCLHLVEMFFTPTLAVLTNVNVMKYSPILTLALACFLSVQPAQAQGLSGLGNKLKQTVKKVATEALESTDNGSTSPVPGNTGPVTNNARPAAHSGSVYYVSQENGSARGAGSLEAPVRDIQKAIDLAKNGDIVRIAQGNYLGTLDRGWIEIKGKYITLEGGWNESFTERNPVKYITKMQPGPEQRGTIPASNGMLYLDATTDPNQQMIIDGLFFDLGLLLEYRPATEDERNGWPGGSVETGRVGEISMPPNPAIRAIGGKVKGGLIIRNCLFTNIAFHGIILSQRGGSWEIYNNVFVANHYASVDINGGINASTDAHSATVDFHHNTVAFSWPRTKEFSDMGYGYRFRNGVDHNIHHNIFACNSMAALDGGWDDSNLPADKRKICSATDNRFFMNKGDLSIAGTSGGAWIFVKSKRFDEATMLTGYERNAELGQESQFINALEPDYLKGFANLKVVSTQSYDPNSAANLYRAAHGLNQQGSSTTRVTMHGNRYNMDKAIALFGAEAGYGAQGF